MDDALGAKGDRRRVGDEEARVVSTRPAGRRDRARDEVEAVERRRDAGRGEARPCACGRARCAAPPSATPTARPVSSKVSRIAASASARARAGEGRRVAAISLASTNGSSGAATLMRRSAGSSAPPGKTYLLGMKAWPGWRLPSRTRAAAVRAIDEDQRRRVARPQRGRRARRVARVRRLAEAVHAHRPLVADQRALDPRQHRQAERGGERGPDERVDQHRRVRPDVLGGDDAGDDEMADDQNRDVGRRVVGALRGEILAADRAGVVDLEIGAEQPPFAATRAAAGEAAPHREAERALRRRGRFGLGHRRRSFLARGPRLPPSDSISKRSAPANGAASTSRTSTVSPRRKVSPLREPTKARLASSKR